MTIQRSAADKPLALGPQMRRDQDDFGGEYPKARLGQTGELAAVEVVIGKQSRQVLDDVIAPALDRAEGVDPVGIVGIHVPQRLRVAIVERLQQRPADRFLVRTAVATATRTTG